MRIGDIMNTDVKTAMPDSSIHEVAITMCFNRISGMPVVDVNDVVVGVISEKDILRAMYPGVNEYMEQGCLNFETLEESYTDVLNYHVAELMSDKVFSMTPGLPVLKAASIMCLNSIRRTPVSDKGRLVGIVTLGDVHKAVFQQSLARRSANLENLTFSRPLVSGQPH